MTSTLLQFETLPNIRDLGGMVTADGRRVAKGRLIRCGHLSQLPPKEAERLGMLVDTVVDFRTDGERKEQPDVVLADTACHHIPIVDSLTAGISREQEAAEDVFRRLAASPDQAKAYMCSMYRAFVENDGCLAGYARFVRILLHPGEHAVLWHCTAGKDRAGTASVIVEELLGISREDVIADYLMTRDCLAEDIISLTKMVRQQANLTDDRADQGLRYMFGAEEEYVLAFYEAAERRFGSFDGFIREGLGISDKEREKLQELYLVRT